MADIEGAERGLAFTSGMAALTAVTRLVKAGEVSGGHNVHISRCKASSNQRRVLVTAVCLSMC